MPVASVEAESEERLAAYRKNVRTLGLVDDPTEVSGRESVPTFDLPTAKQILLFVLYDARSEHRSQGNTERDARIRGRCEAGETISDLAREYGVSAQRVWQIVIVRQMRWHFVFATLFIQATGAIRRAGAYPIGISGSVITSS